MTREVRLYGHLGERFGRVHHYAVRNPAEALRALCATLPGFRAWLIRHSTPGYRVLVGHQPRDLDTLAHPADATIRIVPVIAGAGGSVGKVLLGAALIGVGVMTGGAGMTLSSAWSAGAVATAGYFATNIGISLVLGGVSEMLAPQPNSQNVPERPANQPSYLFDGPVNTAAQGQAVQLCYGEMMVGSQVISAGIAAEEYVP